MTTKAELLKVKAHLKKVTPKFIRQDAHKHKRLGNAWRAPKGLHSKMRDSRRGYRRKLQCGFQSPAALRGMDKHGLLPTVVATVAQLSTLDPKTHSIIVSGTLGGRKKIMVVEEAAKKKFTIANVKVDAQSLKDNWKARHEQKVAHQQDKEVKKKNLEEKAKEIEQSKKDKDETVEDAVKGKKE